MQHCPGIGPARLKQLRTAGVVSWSDVLEYPDRVPASQRGSLVEECARCVSALDASDVSYFIEHFVPQDKWRILAHFFDQASFFDIETSGLESDAAITVIACWHRGQIYNFVEHENLDDFLNLLDDMTLLVSFNGSSFDVPRVLDSFHIPTLPCPHLDVRWSCFHRGLRGGLKGIAHRLGVRRPTDLEGVDGAEAIHLWNAWVVSEDQQAKQRLLRYCAADVVLLRAVAGRLAGRPSSEDDASWSLLDALAHESPVIPSGTSAQPSTPASRFGDGSPAKLRAWRAFTRGMRSA